MTSALKQNTYDIGDGVTPTSTNTATTGDAITIATSAGTPTATALSAAGFSGQGLRIVAAAADVHYHQFTQTGNLQAVSRLYFKVSSSQLPGTSAHAFLNYRNSSAKLVKVIMGTNGVVQLQTGSGTSLKLFYNNAKLPDGWYYICVELAPNSTTSASGSLSAGIYDATSNTLVTDGSYSGTVDLGTTGVTTMVWGKPESSGVLSNGFDVDNPAFDVGTSTRIGAAVVVVATPTVSAAVSPTSADTGVERTLTLIMSNGNGNAITWGPVNWGDGLANDAAVTTSAGVTSKTFKRTPTVAGAGKSGSYSWSQA